MSQRIPGTTVHVPEQRTWIGGVAEPSDVEELDSLHDASTGAALAVRRSSSLEQVRRAIEAADEAHAEGSWLGAGAEARSAVLHGLADALDAMADDIATLDAVQSGVPIGTTRLFAGSNGDTVRAAADRAVAVGDERDVESAPEQGRVRVRRVPWGPSALILPWNAPSAMAVKKLAYALATGTPAVVKPSPASPWSAELVMRAAEEAGVPRGLVSLVHGGADVGAALVGDARIRSVSMTGSTATGRAIAAAAAPRFARLRLELGSSNPVVVLDGADVDAAASDIVAGALRLSGQWCEAPRRVIAPASMAQRLEAAIVARLQQVRIGSSLDESTELGPVAFEARRAQLEAQIEELAVGAAAVHRVGTTPAEGWFVPPTLVVEPGSVPREEIFGPVLTLQAVDSVDDAVELANSGQVGLAGYVLGPDLDAASAVAERLVAGEVKTRGSSVLDLSPESSQSFFGASGIGGHGDADVLDFFVGTQIIGADRLGLPL